MQSTRHDSRIRAARPRASSARTAATATSAGRRSLRRRPRQRRRTCRQRAAAATTARPAPYCGDGERNGPEQCDWAPTNTGEYGTCNADCTFAPRCGDNVKQGAEECDDGPTGSLTCTADLQDAAFRCSKAESAAGLPRLPGGAKVPSGMRIALLYPPPWKISAPGEPRLAPADGGPPSDYQEGDLDADFFQTPYGLLSLGAQALRAGHQVKVLQPLGLRLEPRRRGGGGARRGRVRAVVLDGEPTRRRLGR